MTAAAPPSRGNDPLRRRLRVAAFADGSFALASGIVGAGLLGSVQSEFPALRQLCTVRPCQSADWRSLESRADAGYAMVALAGAAALVDVALFWRGYRRSR